MDHQFGGPGGRLWSQTGFFSSEDGEIHVAFSMLGDGYDVNVRSSWRFQRRMMDEKGSKHLDNFLTSKREIDKKGC